MSADFCAAVAIDQEDRNRRLRLALADVDLQTIDGLLIRFLLSKFYAGVQKKPRQLQAKGEDYSYKKKNASIALRSTHNFLNLRDVDIVKDK